MIVQYYADSLGLSREGVVELNQRYIYLFEQWLKQQYKGETVFLIDRARRAFTVDKLFEVYKEDIEYITGEKDILIIHEGICDCAPRPVPRWFRKIVSQMPAFARIRMISFLHKNRSFLLKTGFKSYLVKKKKFENLWKEWLTIAARQFKRIYVFNIAPTNNGTEAHSPGFQESIIGYNSILRQVISDIGKPTIKLLDVHSIISENPNEVDQLIVKEDGHHITALGHSIYAQQLINAEKSFFKGND